MGKKEPKHVKGLINRALAAKAARDRAKAAKKATLAQRFIPRKKGHR